VPVDSLPAGEDERLQLLHKVTGAQQSQHAGWPPQLLLTFLGAGLLLLQLTAAPPSEEHWEVGGNCNVLIAVSPSPKAQRYRKPPPLRQ
jgi:hypothetical protein